MQCAHMVDTDSRETIVAPHPDDTVADYPR